MDDNDPLAIPEFMRQPKPEAVQVLDEEYERQYGPSDIIEALDPNPEPMACRGVLVGIKQVKSSGDLRVEITIPQNEANNAFEKLGKFIDPAKSRWVALAVIQTGDDA